MQGIKRRLVYVTLYELLAILLSAVLLRVMLSQSAGQALGVAVVASAMAIVWNLVFNYGFERWEATRRRQGRSLGIRLLHALGFEGGLMLWLLPMLAWWYGVSLWQALVMDLGLLVFFLVYTFCFNWAFDRVFGLPASARHPAAAAS